MIDKYTYDRNETIKLAIKDFLVKSVTCIEFIGKYSTWEEALSVADGYDAEAIYEKTCKAALEVKNGNAKYERDSCLFYDEEKYYELLYLVERVINETGKAQILDFGGGLGSMYFQHIDYFKVRNNISWTVVEQSDFVTFGRENLENEQLHFKDKIDDVKDFNLAILGSVLQYIENYQDYLDSIFAVNPKYIFIDRTPMSSATWITVEKVHKPIYEASYPLHVFDNNQFRVLFENHGYHYEGGWHPNTGNIFRWKNRKAIFESMIWRRDE